MDIKKMLKDAARKQQDALTDALKTQANTALGKIGLSLSDTTTSPAIIEAPERDSKDEAAFWQVARKAADLPTSGRVRSTSPAGFPNVPPSNGMVNAETAGTFGNGWWRIYKMAEEAGREPAEISKYKSIAYRWYAIRDKG